MKMTKKDRLKMTKHIMDLNEKDTKAAMCYLLGYGAKGEVTLDEGISKVCEKLSFGDCVGDVKFDPTR